MSILCFHGYYYLWRLAGNLNVFVVDQRPVFVIGIKKRMHKSIFIHEAVG